MVTDAMAASEPDDEAWFFRNAEDPFFVVREGVVEAVNPAWTRISGWPAEACIGRPYWDFLHPADFTVVRDLYGCLEGEISGGAEHRIRYRDGSLPWVRTRVQRAPGGRIRVVLRESSGPVMNSAAEARARDLADVTHEMRNPANGLLGLLHILKADPGAGDAAGLIDRALACGDALMSLLNEAVRIDEGRPASAPLHASEPVPAGGWLEGLRILVVEDNATNRLVASRILGELGAVVDTAEDGAHGVARARAAAYDLILMDIQMPVMDGVEATRRIRALPGPSRDARIVATTANVLARQMADYRAAGMDGCLAKPISPAALLGEISRLAEAA